MEDRQVKQDTDSVSVGILVAGWDKVNGGQVHTMYMIFVHVGKTRHVIVHTIYMYIVLKVEC